MSFNADIKTARIDIETVKQECLSLVEQAEKALANARSSDRDILRLMTVPILYSAWERLFTLCNAIRIKLIQQCLSQCRDYPPIERVAWLFKEPFFRSFQDRCANKGIDHEGLEEFLCKLDKWLMSPLSNSLNAEDLPITKSNVNKEVVQLNAKLFGLENQCGYRVLDLSKLDEPVGRRNSIGHGGTTKSPGPKELADLVEYVKSLIHGYAQLISISLPKLRKG